MNQIVYVFNYFITRYYLHRRKRASDVACPNCQHPTETAEHTILDWAHWESMRLTVNGFISNRKVTPSDVQDLLCGPTDVPIYINDRIQATSQRATQAFYEMVEAILRREACWDWSKSQISRMRFQAGRCVRHRAENRSEKRELALLGDKAQSTISWLIIRDMYICTWFIVYDKCYSSINNDSTGVILCKQTLLRRRLKKKKKKKIFGTL